MKNLTGMRFGRWTVLEYAGEEKNKKGVNSFRAMWLCRCDCGVERIIASRSLRAGESKSCGCFRSYVSRNINRLPFGEAAKNVAYGEYIRSAKRRGLEFSLTIDQFHHLAQLPCHYCGIIGSNKTVLSKNDTGIYVYNGIDRINNNIGYIEGNIVTCCKQCNYAKGTLGFDEFIAWINRVYKHMTGVNDDNNLSC